MIFFLHLFILFRGEEGPPVATKITLPVGTPGSPSVFILPRIANHPFCLASQAHTSLTSLHTSSSSKTPGGIFCSRPPRRHCTLFSLLLIIFKKTLSKEEGQPPKSSRIHKSEITRSLMGRLQSARTQQAEDIYFLSKSILFTFLYRKYLDTTFHV